MGREIRPRDDLGPGRQGYHLILMADRDGYGFGTIFCDKAGTRLDVICVAANAPALGRLDDLAAKGLGDGLMAEADADLRHLRVGCAANERHQRRHPGLVIIDASG